MASEPQNIYEREGAGLRGRTKERNEVGGSGEHAGGLGRNPKGRKPKNLSCPVFRAEHSVMRAILPLGTRETLSLSIVPRSSLLVGGRRQFGLDFLFTYCMQGPNVVTNSEIPGMELEIIPWSSFVKVFWFKIFSSAFLILKRSVRILVKLLHWLLSFCFFFLNKRLILE